MRQIKDQFAFFLFLIGCCLPFQIFAASNEAAPTAIEINQNVDLLVQGNDRFGFDLYHELNTKKGNFCFSPYGISLLFQMIAAGGRGETTNEIQRVVHYQVGYSSLVGNLIHRLMNPSSGKNAPQLVFASALWIQRDNSLLPTFEQALKRDFDAYYEPVDFFSQPVQAIRSINQWCSKVTQGKINLMVTPQDITTTTQLILTSAAFIRAQWAQPFDVRSTSRGNFSVQNRQIQVEMMKVTSNFPLYVDTHFALIEIPYVNQTNQSPQLSMFIVIPDEKDTLEGLEKNFTFDNLQKWRQELKLHHVQLSIPRFRLEERLDLNQTMVELGLIKTFNDSADFTGMTGEKGLFINKAIQKTFIRVDERGSDAITSTIGMNAKAATVPEDPIEFTANRPFIFVVMDKQTLAILMMGRVVQP